MMKGIERKYLLGKALYGDDFSSDQIEAWYRDESEAYAHLPNGRELDTEYPYRALIEQSCFRYLPKNLRFSHLLGFGSAYGQELIPLIDRVDKLTICESSGKYVQNRIEDVPVRYVKPSIYGDLPFENESFDLIVCFGVLHHIANVSKVVKEFYRCLTGGGWLLISEPITAMGDWTKHRPGMTKRERGIPIGVFRRIIRSAGLEIINEQKNGNTITKRLIKPFYEEICHRAIWNSRTMVRIDSSLCNYVDINRQYYPIKRYRGPKASRVSYVLRKL